MMLVKILIVGAVCVAVWVAMALWGMTLTHEMRRERRSRLLRAYFQDPGLAYVSLARALDDLGRQIGEALGPALTKMARAAGRAVEAFAKLPGPEA